MGRRERKDRRYYEFPNSLKRKVKQEQKHRCMVTGEKTRHLEVHHCLGVAIASGWFPTVDPAIFRQKENAVALDPKIHKQLHEEQKRWSKEFTRLFVIGVYAYLRDLHYDKLAEQELELTAV